MGSPVFPGKGEQRHREASASSRRSAAPGSGLGWPGPALGTRAFNNADEALAINYSSPPPPCRGQRAGRQRWAEDGAERVSEGPPCGEAAGLLLLGSCWGGRGRCQAPAIPHGVPASRPPGQLSGVLVSPAGKAGVLVSGKNLLVSETTPAPCPPAPGPRPLSGEGGARPSRCSPGGLPASEGALPAARSTPTVLARSPSPASHFQPHAPPGWAGDGLPGPLPSPRARGSRGCRQVRLGEAPLRLAVGTPPRHVACSELTHEALGLEKQD